MNKVIELKNVSKKFVKQKAIDDLDFTFNKGTIIGIIGENGSGKSTLLKMIAGLLHPTKGSVLIDERSAHRRISSLVAYMTDSNQFYPFFTIEQLLDFYESQFHDFDRNKANQIITFMNLSTDEKINHLSKGNRGRVKMAVTLARQAPYILLDEPFSGLDPMVRASIVKGLIQFIDLEKQMVIVTTHEIKDVEPLLDEAIVLKAGKILDHQNIDTIRSDYQVDVEGWLKQVYEGAR